MAQASSSRSGIQDMLECCICYEEYSDPRMLPCIHTFCLKCLEKTGVGMQPGDNMPCPICRTAFKIPEAGIVGIQKNFFMESLIDMQHLSKVDSSVILCQACAEDPGDEVPHAVMLCVECDEKLCDGCCRSHRKNKASKEHQLIDLKDKDMIKQRTRNLIKSFCVRHKSKPIEMYCLDCESANCVVCQLESHQGHKCSDVDKIGKEFRMNLQANNENISHYSDLIKEEMNELEKYGMSFLNRTAKLQNDILTQATSIKEMVDQHAGKLLQEINSVKQTKQKEIQNKKEELIALITMLESYERYTAEIIEKGSSVDICRTFKEMNERSDELQKNHNRAVTDVHSYLNNVLLLSLCPSKFVEGIHLKNTENMIGKLNSTETFRAVLHKEISKGVEVRGVSISVNELFVVRKNISEIEVYDTDSFKCKQKLSVTGLKPCDMTSTELKTGVGHIGTSFILSILYITNWDDCLVHKVVLESLHLKDMWKKSIISAPVWNVVDRPDGISLTETGTLLVTFRDMGKVREYNEDGTVLKEVCLGPGIDRPRHTIRLKDGSLLFCHGYNRSKFRVCIASADGRIQLKHDENDEPKSNGHYSPTHLAVDSKGFVYVGDFYNNRVIILNAKLKFVQELIPPHVGLQQPFRLCLDESKKRLHIGEYSRGGRVMIFDIK